MHEYILFIKPGEEKGGQFFNCTHLRISSFHMGEDLRFSPRSVWYSTQNKGWINENVEVPFRVRRVKIIAAKFIFDSEIYLCCVCILLFQLNLICIDWIQFYLISYISLTLSKVIVTI